MKRALSLALALAILLPALAWAEEMMSVRSEWTNFRQGPSTNDPVLFKGSRYYPVKIIDRKGGWYKVADFEGEQAWALGRLLAKVECVAVKVDRANLRKTPDIKAQVIFTAARGASFKILKKQGKWLLVEHADGDKGWIHSSIVWGL